MGSMTWEEMGRELGPISLTVTVFFREAFPKRDTWAGLLSLALEPRGLLVLEPHQEARPTQPGSHQIREGCNGTNWLLLKKNNRRAPTLPSDLVLETRSKENRSGPDDEFWEE